MRYSSYGRLDSQLSEEGDNSFIGIDMKHDRPTLPQGILARCENKRLRRGIAETRPGITYPGDFNPAFDNIFEGSGIYSNPNGSEIMLIACRGDAFVWGLSYGNDPVQIPLPTLINGLQFVIPTTPVQFVQSFDKVLLLTRDQNLVWDGQSPAGFVVVTKSDPGDTSTLLVPPGMTNGTPFESRILYYKAAWPPPYNDMIIMSDVLDYSSYDPALAVFRINSGEADRITCVFPYYRQSVLVFMQRSVHVLENFTIDPTLAAQRMINSQLGSVSLRAPVQLGADVIFLSEPGGFYRIGEVIQDYITAQPVPISDPIQPIIDRINWSQGQVAVSAVLGEYAYFGVPLDGALRNNSILVFNTTTNQWESAPDSSIGTVNFDNLLITTYNGARRLFAIDHGNQAVYLMYEGIYDQLQTNIYNIHDVIETRGYGANSEGGPNSFHSFKRLTLPLQTYNPSIVVTAITEGYNELKALLPNPLTKDRTKFYPHAEPDYIDGVTDPTLPKREDYSPLNDLNFAPQDFEAIPIGSITVIPGSTPLVSPPPNRQRALERVNLRVIDRWVSIQIANTQGTCDVLGATVDSLPAKRAPRVAA